MKNLNGLRFIFAAVFLVGLFSSLSLSAQTEPTGRRFRVIREEKLPGTFFLGGTSHENLIDTMSGTILAREFSYITPANDFKQSTIHPDNSDTWNWTKPDRWIDYANTHNQVIRMHSPISPQASVWAMTDSRTARELETNMRDFMRELCIRYNGNPRVKWMDVVNETVNNGAWFGPKGGTSSWENPWPKIGYDNDSNQTPLYIKYAFEVANQYAPDIKLIINQHEKVLTHGTWNLIKDTVFYLRNQGLRVDGIGWQAHMDAGWENISGQKDFLRDLIDWAHQNELEFHVTENDVFLKGGDAGNWQKQADTFAALMEILLEKRNNGVITWNLWHMRDDDGWLPQYTPRMFFNDGTAKPAYYAVQALLEELAPIPTPSIKGDVNDDGIVDIIDAMLTARYTAGLNPPGFFTANGDVNCDGQVDIIDALMIARFSAGLIFDFDC